MQDMHIALSTMCAHFKAKMLGGVKPSNDRTHVCLILGLTVAIINLHSHCAVKPLQACRYYTIVCNML